MPNSLFYPTQRTITDAWEDVLMPPRRKEEAGMTEHQEQVALMKMCKLHEQKYPGLELIHAIPNGGQRHIAVAKKLKAEGVKAGVPYLFLPVPRKPFYGLYVELKAKGGSVTDSQRAMLVALEKQGYACIVAYGWAKAWDKIEAYMQSKTIVPLSEVFGWAQV